LYSVLKNIQEYRGGFADLIMFAAALDQPLDKARHQQRPNAVNVENSPRPPVANSGASLTSFYELR
jgi:hypothetical protein